ncbi:hypothetical protein Ga0609869_002568 [Rhodovulum iodosum]|uniref:Uncharacterized protein n=1 Tax=Rhodovulum iodosum TaxID=68291 RepID=A0ABV3XV49_9RHOB|nr:hypothetical protein [Rhodovulum robiginosum]RSK33599.1 hypothetical protein EJA01_09945 [Rhodovulum robiginosum]
MVEYGIAAGGGARVGGGGNGGGLDSVDLVGWIDGVASDPVNLGIALAVLLGVILIYRAI